MSRNAEIILNGLEAICIYMREESFSADEIKAAMEKYHAWVVNGIDVYKGTVN